VPVSGEEIIESAISRMQATGIWLAQPGVRWRTMSRNAQAWLAGKFRLAAL
jgi:hypothetical protein